MDLKSKIRGDSNTNKASAGHNGNKNYSGSTNHTNNKNIISSSRALQPRAHKKPTFIGFGNKKTKTVIADKSGLKK